MSEGMNVEAAHSLIEAKTGTPRTNRRWEELVEFAEIIILAIVAVATAWSGYQAAKWDGRQASLYATATRLRIEADQAATLGGQQRLLDVSTFNTWIQAHELGEERVADLYVERFSPEYQVAFDAWLAMDPFSNPQAPPGPAYMPEYHNQRLEQAARLNDRASAAFDAGTEARETADRYVRQTVLLATALFLVAISQRFKIRGVRIAASALAAALTVLALVGTVSMERL